MVLDRPQDVVSPALCFNRQTQLVLIHLAVGVILVVLNDHLNTDSHADSFQLLRVGKSLRKEQICPVRYPNRVGRARRTSLTRRSIALPPARPCPLASV